MKKPPKCPKLEEIYAMDTFMEIGEKLIENTNKIAEYLKEIEKWLYDTSQEE